MAGSPEFRLFGTSGCHLCEQAEALIQQAVSPERWQAFDVTDDTRWMHSYGSRIPVFRHERSGAELAWPFGRGELDKFLEANVCPIPLNPHQPTITPS